MIDFHLDSYWWRAMHDIIEFSFSLFFFGFLLQNIEHLYFKAVIKHLSNMPMAYKTWCLMMYALVERGTIKNISADPRQWQKGCQNEKANDPKCVKTEEINVRDFFGFQRCHKISIETCPWPASRRPEFLKKRKINIVNQS